MSVCAARFSSWILALTPKDRRQRIRSGGACPSASKTTRRPILYLVRLLGRLVACVHIVSRILHCYGVIVGLLLVYYGTTVSISVSFCGVPNNGSGVYTASWPRLNVYSFETDQYRLHIPLPVLFLQHDACSTCAW